MIALIAMGVAGLIVGFVFGAFAVVAFATAMIDKAMEGL